jgi:hypothetical protein
MPTLDFNRIPDDRVAGKPRLRRRMATQTVDWPTFLDGQTC